MFIAYDRDSELYHHGILGMHWGVRRYQPYPKGHTGGKEIGNAARKPSRKEAKATKKAEKLERKKQDAIVSGDYKKVQKYAKIMDSKEYAEAVQRCNTAMNMQMNAMNMSIRRGETMFGNIKNASSAVSSAITIHDGIATISNALAGTNFTTWTGNRQREMENARFKVDYGIDPDNNWKPIGPDDPFYELYRNKLTKGKIINLQ